MWFVELTSHIAVIVASVVAILGVSAWRREFKGKRDIELAENVLELFYRAGSAIEAIRCNLSFGEGQTRVPEAGETAEQKKARDAAWVVFKRIEDRSKTFDQLYALRFRFMARFGRDKVEPFDKMKRVVAEISVSARRLAELWPIRAQRSISKDTENQIKKHEAVIWDGYGDEEDQIAPRVKNTVEQIEGMCRPIIDGKKSVCRRLWGWFRPPRNPS